MGLRVVQWATGGVGVAAIKGVLEHPDLDLAGCWVHSPDKAGRDVGELVGNPAPNHSASPPPTASRHPGPRRGTRSSIRR